MSRKYKKYRLPDSLRRILDECGVPWSLDFRRSHVMVRVAGRAALTLPAHSRGGAIGNVERNAQAALRKFIRENGNG